MRWQFKFSQTADNAAREQLVEGLKTHGAQVAPRYPGDSNPDRAAIQVAEAKDPISAVVLIALLTDSNSIDSVLAF